MAQTKFRRFCHRATSLPLVILALAICCFAPPTVAVTFKYNWAASENGAVASASSTYSSLYPTASINDGDRLGNNWGNGGGWSDSTPDSYPDWVQIDFPAAKSISSIDVYMLQDDYATASQPYQNTTFTKYGLTAFEVQYWNGTSWLAVPNGVVTNNDKVLRQFAFDPITTRKIRVLVYGSLQGYSRIVEVEALGDDVGNPPPTVSLTSPINGAQYTSPATLVLTADAYDSDGIQRVEFYQGSTLLDTVSAAPYTYSWAGVPPGSYYISARAIDTLGADNWASGVNVSVLPPNPPPEVSLITPGSGQVYTTTATIPVTAGAADSDGIQKVEFYQGSTLLATDTDAPFGFDWTGLTAGNYTLTAKAYDNLGAVATSSPVSINVTASAAGSSKALPPVADAYVQNGNNANKNYGTATDLRVQTNATARGNYASYLKFDTASAIGQVTGAKLRLYAALSKADNVSSSVNAVSNSTWGETTLTWNNKPAFGSALGGFSTTTKSFAWKEIDVTSYIQGEKAAGRDVVSFGLQNVATSAAYVTINSRNASSNRPELVITTAPANLPPTASLTSPTHGQTFTWPATINLKANAVDPDGKITKVEFYSGPTLLASDSTAPYSFDWAGMPEGTYSLTAKAYDNAGSVVSSSAVTVNVASSPLSLAVEAPFDGSNVTGSQILVTGIFTGPKNTGVSVSNGTVVTDGGKFYADVSLEQGLNVITVVATAPNGATLQKTIYVTSTSPAPYRIRATSLEGVAPLTVRFDVIANASSKTADYIVADFENYGGFVAELRPPYTSFEHIYGTPGTYFAKFLIHDPQGDSDVVNIPIVVKERSESEGLFVALWADFNAALIAGDKAKALTFLTPNAREKYDPVFTTLLPDFPTIISTYSPLQSGLYSSDIAEFAVNRAIEGVDNVFLIYFIKGDDGIWRLDEM